jgi:ankyrin repeat protein
VLLAAPAINVKAKAMDHMTALHFAAQNGHTEVVRMLITAGLPVNSKTRKDVTALHFACQKGVPTGPSTGCH